MALAKFDIRLPSTGVGLFMEFNDSLFDSVTIRRLF